MNWKDNLVEGDLLKDILQVDDHGLAYLTLKHDLTLIDPWVKTFRRKSLGKYRDFGLQQESLLTVVQRYPERLSSWLYWLPELEAVTERVNRTSIEHHKRQRESRSTNVAMFSLALRDVEEQDLSDAEVEQSIEELSEPPPRKTIKDVIEDHENDIKEYSNVFSMLGKVWFVKFFQTEWGLYPDQEKYKYIAHILKLTEDRDGNGSTEYSLHNTDLYSRVKNHAVTDEPLEYEESEEMNPSDLADILSPDEMDKFQEIGYQLLSELKKARLSGDTKSMEGAEENIGKYRSHLSSQYGILVSFDKGCKKLFFRRFYRASKENEKIRQLLKNQINNTIKDFKEAMPAFAKHLRNCIKLKLYQTVYSPEQPQAWHVAIR